MYQLPPHFRRVFCDWFPNKPTDRGNETTPTCAGVLFSTILLGSDCQVIRAFLDVLLGKCRPTKEVLKEYGEKLNELWDETEVNGVLVGFDTALHIAATENTAHIIGLLLDSLQPGEHSNATIKMLLVKDDNGQTAWHVAAENESVEALGKMWEWAEVQPNSKALKEKLLLPNDRYGYTAWD